MQEPTFLILTALAAGAQHGYGIMNDVARISDGRVRLRAGTLYAALDRLKADGLVTGDKEEIVDGRLRRYYRITDEGRSVLDTFVVDWTSFRDAVDALLPGAIQKGV